MSSFPLAVSTAVANIHACLTCAFHDLPSIRWHFRVLHCFCFNSLVAATVGIFFILIFDYQAKQIKHLVRDQPSVPHASHLNLWCKISAKLKVSRWPLSYSILPKNFSKICCLTDSVFIVVLELLQALTSVSPWGSAFFSLSGILQYSSRSSIPTFIPASFAIFLPSLAIFLPSLQK